MFDLTHAANTAAERLAASADKSNLKFYQITRDVVRGQGITNPSSLDARTRELRAELRRRSALKRKAEVETKRQAKQFAARIAS